MTLPRTVVLQVLGRSAGGIARHVAELVGSIDNSAFDVHVAGPSSSPVEMPVPVHALEIPDGPFGHRAATTALRSLIHELGAGVVHAHGLRAGIDSGRAAAGNTPVVVTVHNLVHPAIAGRLKAPLYGIAERLVMTHADRVFCVSQQIRDHLAAKAPGAAHKLEVLYLGVTEPPAAERSREAVRSELGMRGEPLVVTASRLSSQKDLPTLFEAMARLPEPHLAILGEGPLLASLEAMSGRLGIEDRVHFLGFRNDLADYLRAADAFCLSSIWEGVPLSAQEAILVATPVVATRVGGMSELIEDGVSGRLVSPGDAPALAAALGQVLSDEDLARRFADEARKRLTQRFSRGKMLERLTSEYLASAR